MQKYEKKSIALVKTLRYLDCCLHYLLKIFSNPYLINFVRLKNHFAEGENPKNPEYVLAINGFLYFLTVCLQT